MPRSPRSQRVADLIQHTLAPMLQHEAKDPRFAAVTITAVDVSPDLSNAIVFVSMLEETQIASTIAALNKASGYFRHRLADAVELRITPRLHFRFDESISRADRITKLINEALNKKD